MHQYWHREGSTDVEVMRRDAHARLNDKVHPEESIIHYHDKGTDCEIARHESFNFPEPEPTVVHVDESSKILTWSDDHAG